MASTYSSSGLSFNNLGKSSDFLNEMIHNISSCILILNNKMELQAYNEPLKTIFSDKKDEHLLYKKCGEAIGCAYVVEEEKECGATSQCKYCQLRESAVLSYTNEKMVYKNQIDRNFFSAEGVKTMKHLQFSTRCLRVNKEKYIIVIVDDITRLTNLNKLAQFQSEKINELMSKN
jgi:hypothetical protein